jgi:hypothetical protein
MHAGWGKQNKIRLFLLNDRKYDAGLIVPEMFACELLLEVSFKVTEKQKNDNGQ